MWLLKTDTLELDYFVDDRAADYAILSHTWGDEEVTFRDIREARPKSKKGYRKIQQACQQALKDGHKHIWIDTCCINKDSSAELSEAINSMFGWYAASAVCYVYLEDVSWMGRHDSVDYPESNLGVSEVADALRYARWFSRGWTLQELIAPKHAVFFDQDWSEIGTKVAWCESLALITRIDEDVLQWHNVTEAGRLDSYSIAARMSWAANRRTTRREDRAYSLLGIFGINMPLLYGEGDRAFQRLQEEIVRQTDDQSVLTWDCSNNGHCALLAPSPDAFSSTSQVVRWHGGATSSYQLSNLALEIDLPVLQAADKRGRQREDRYYVVLNCYRKGDLTGPLALCVRRSRDDDRNAQWTFSVQPRSIFGSGIQRARVIPHDALARAVTRKCKLIPRFSDHGHRRLAPLLPSPRFVRRGSRPLWISLPTDKSYVFERVHCIPAWLWTDTGLFRPQGAGHQYRGCCTWEMRPSRSWFKYASEPAVKTLSIGIAFEKKSRDDLRVRLFESAPFLSTDEPTSDDRWLEELTQKAVPNETSMDPDVYTQITAQVKLNQRILDNVVDVISISVSRNLKEMVEDRILEIAHLGLPSSDGGQDAPIDGASSIDYKEENRSS